MRCCCSVWVEQREAIGGISEPLGGDLSDGRWRLARLDAASWLLGALFVFLLLPATSNTAKVGRGSQRTDA
jgi:hypothetical protein